VCGWAEKETEFTLEEIQPKNIAVIKDCVNLYKWQSYEKSHSPKLNPSSKFLLLWDVKCSFSKALPPLFLIEFYNPKWIFGLLFGKIISYIFLLFSIIWSFYVPGNDYNSDSLCFTIKKLIENKCFDFVSHFINDHSWTDWIWKLQTISIKGADLSKNNLKAFIDALVGEKVRILTTCQHI